MPRRARNANGTLTEAAFQQQVLGLASFYNWRAYHTHDSRRSQAGFPDLVLLRAPELIFAELKTDTGRLRPEQADWLEQLQLLADACEPVEVYLWRPADFDEIHARLARGRQLVPAGFDPRA